MLNRDSKSHKSAFPTAHSHGVYYKMGPNDIGKKSIPKKDRCEDFDELWEKIYYQVLESWEFVPINDIKDITG